MKISFKSLSWQQLFTIWQLTIGEELVAESKMRKRDRINLKSDANLPFKFLPQRHFLDILIVTNWRIVTIPKNQLVIEFRCLTLLVLWEKNNSFFFLLFFWPPSRQENSQSVHFVFFHFNSCRHLRWKNKWMNCESCGSWDYPFTRRLTLLTNTD